MGELPVGLLFIAEAWSEPKLLKFVYAFEQGTRSAGCRSCSTGTGNGTSWTGDVQTNWVSSGVVLDGHPG